MTHPVRILTFFLQASPSSSSSMMYASTHGSFPGYSHQSQGMPIPAAANTNGIPNSSNISTHQYGASGAQSSSGQGSQASCVLYLGAIPYNWDVEVIKSVVCGSGPVVDVRCMMDNASKNKGFCFIEYSNADAAAKALSVLSKIKIEGRKKLRIELSKEGLRNPVPGQKPILHLSRGFLPSNVVIPHEMLMEQPDSDTAEPAISSMGSGLPGSKSASAASAEIAASMAANPQIHHMVGQMIANGMDMNQIASVVRQLTRGVAGNSVQASQTGSTQLQQMGPPQVQPGPGGIPPQLAMASQYMPVPQQAAGAQNLYAKDEVSRTLASIPPNVLLELLAKLKLVLSGPMPNYGQAAAILHENPMLAAAAAQSLLLMGIIDLGVINQTLAAGTAPIPAANPVPSSLPAVSNTPPAPQNGSSVPATLPPPPVHAHKSTANNHQPAQATQPAQSSQVNPDWLSLPQHTISKLMTIGKQEAGLIVQVLKLSPQQIANLPDNERRMANQIRSQYL